MSSTISVLVVDDSENLLELMKLAIERLCDSKVIAAKTLQELKLNEKQVFACHLAILDINLGPGEPSGVDIYRWMRSNGFTKPIFFLTGHARSHPLVIEAERLGDAKVLTKPLETNELIKIVRGAQ